MLRTDPSSPETPGHRVAAGIASIIIVAAVVATVRGAVPAERLPAAGPDTLALIPHVNAAVSVLAASTILVGWVAIRRGHVRTHRRAMLVATALFGAFLTLYLYRLVLRGGPHPFPGPARFYRLVYLPVLATHIALAVLCIPLLTYALTLAITVPSRRLPATPHARIGRLAAPLWLVSFVLGIVVYAMLYGPWWS